MNAERVDGSSVHNQLSPDVCGRCTSRCPEQYVSTKVETSATVPLASLFFGIFVASLRSTSQRPSGKRKMRNRLKQTTKCLKKLERTETDAEIAEGSQREGGAHGGSR